MKCPIHKCKAGCCYNVPFPRGFIDSRRDKVVSKPKATLTLYNGRAEMYITDPDFDKNKCPFLRADCKCNIYEERPQVCRDMAAVPRMPCPFLGQIVIR